MTTQNTINVANIIINSELHRGDKLYSSVFGDLTFEDVIIDRGGDHSHQILTIDHDGKRKLFAFDGHLLGYEKGEMILFPSNTMRDWLKLSWKKGDVLVSNYGKKNIIFVEFIDDTYTSFKGQYGYEEPTFNYDTEVIATQDYGKATYSIAAYLSVLEKKLGGKLNMETLEIEKKPLFNDGDILVFSFKISGMMTHVVLIFKEFTSEDEFSSHVCKNALGSLVYEQKRHAFSKEAQLRYATEDEKQQLFEALAKEGKRWNAETKQIENIETKWTPKAFERVLVRDNYYDIWSANFFSHMKYNRYITINNCDWKYCIPYNEETAKLIGTTDNWEEN